RDYKGNDMPDWISVQAVLWQIINSAFPDAEEQLAQRFDTIQETTRVPQIVRFLGSATEQEIWRGALAIPDAQRHVLAYSRTISSIDLFEGKAGFKDFVNTDIHGRIDPVNW